MAISNADTTKHLDVAAYARLLINRFGARAASIAGRKARQYERDDNADQATMWRKIERIIMGLRGPAES